MLTLLFPTGVWVNDCITGCTPVRSSLVRLNRMRWPRAIRRAFDTSGMR